MIALLCVGSCANALTEETVMEYPVMTDGIDSVSVWTAYLAAIKGRTKAAALANLHIDGIRNHI